MATPPSVTLPKMTHADTEVGSTAMPESPPTSPSVSTLYITGDSLQELGRAGACLMINAEKNEGCINAN
jgi:hypothetical protein